MGNIFLSKMKLQQKIVQRAKLNAEQILSINLLHANNVTLYEQIRRELEENFFLDEELPITPQLGSDFTREYSDKFLLKSPHQQSLSEYLIDQYNRQVSDKRKRAVAFSIISSLDKHGFLLISVAQPHEKKDQILFEEVRRAIMLLDPIGCGARDAFEAMLQQAQHLHPEDSFLLSITPEDLHDFLDEDYFKTKHLLTQDEYQELQQIFNKLHLYPAARREFQESINTSKIIPDIIVRFLEDGSLDFVINDKWLPKLILKANYFRQLLERAKFKKKDNELPIELMEKYKKAQHLIFSIERRRKTIHKVMTYLLEMQEIFFKRGYDTEKKNLKMLDWSMASNALKMSVSTLSRAISNKIIQTRWGIIRGESFFYSSKREKKEERTVLSQKIQKMISQEEKENPMSDDLITRKINQLGYKISRRTIAKYRKDLNIQGRHMRKKRKLSQVTREKNDNGI